MGRNVKYTPGELWEAAVKYFNDTENDPLTTEELVKGQNLETKTVKINKKRVLTLRAFAASAGMSHDYLTDLRKGQKNKLKRLKDDKTSSQLDINECEDYLETIDRIKNIIFIDKFEGAAAGIYSTAFIARDLGLTDKKEVVAEIEEKKTVIMKIGDQEFEL